MTTTSSGATTQSRLDLLKRFFPFLGWQRFTAQTIREDIIAGITVSLVAIPQALAYAQLAGVPPYYGLYAAFIPTIIGVLFGSSAILSTGPVAMTSLLTAASIAPFAAAGSEQFYAYAILLALLSGLIQIGFGLARMGVLLNFLSHPVLMGFINAAALIIAISQIPAFLGISIKQSKHLLLDTWNVLTNFDSLHGMSLAFGLGAFALLLLLQEDFPQAAGRIDYRRVPYLDQLRDRICGARRQSGRRDSNRLAQPDCSLLRVAGYARFAAGSIRGGLDQLRGGHVELQGDRLQDPHALG